jgi:hypothetical protein
MSAGSQEASMTLWPYWPVPAKLSPTSGTGVSEPSLSLGSTFRCLLGRDMLAGFARSAPSSVPAANFGCLLTTPVERSNGKPSGRLRLE